MDDYEQVIRRVLSAHGRLTAGIDDLGHDDSLYGAGLTSHASVNVMLAIEDELDVEFPERLLRRSTFETIASLLDALGQIVGADV